MSTETRTQIEKLQTANETANKIIAGFVSTAENAPDVVKARHDELSAMKKEDLIAHILVLEAPKADKAVRVEEVVKALLTEPACAIFNYDTVASLVQKAIPGAKTSGKTVASYASKKNAEWGVIKRERFVVDASEYMKLALAANQ